MESTTEKKLTNKEQAYLQRRLDHPTESKAESARKAGYSPKIAKEMAYQVEKKPHITSLLDKNVKLFESVIVKTVKDYSKSDRLGERTLAVKTAQWSHDKVKGTAVQRVQTENLHLTMAIETPDLSFYKDRHKA